MEKERVIDRFVGCCLPLLGSFLGTVICLYRAHGPYASYFRCKTSWCSTQPDPCRHSFDAASYARFKTNLKANKQFPLCDIVLFKDEGSPQVYLNLIVFGAFGSYESYEKGIYFLAKSAVLLPE
jgi:hypothetical protein